MSGKVELPQTISILSPRPSGTLSRNRQNPKGPDPQRAFRCHDDKWSSIVEASKVLGMSTPEFCRWVSYVAANEVLRIAREQKVIAPPKAVELKVVDKKPQSVLPDPVRTVLNPYGLK